MNKRHSFQLKLLAIAKHLSLRAKWTQLSTSLIYLNRIITRNYIDSYWKYLFQIIYRKLPHSIESVPQFIDCLHQMNTGNQNEIIFSFINLLLSKNCFQSCADLLKVYHLTAKYEAEGDMNVLINSLNTDAQYINWKLSISDNTNSFHEQIADRNAHQLLSLVESLDIADPQIQKLIEIYTHYGRIEELEILLEDYAARHPNYLNAQKYLFNFHMLHNNTCVQELFHRIAKLSPADSYVLNYCQKLNDTIISIDCIFDMLDHFQWKFSLQCWSYLSQLLIQSKNEEMLQECIAENWSIRQSYWIPYHFNRLNTNKKFKKVNLFKLDVAIILLGLENKFVSKMIKAYSLEIESYYHLVETHDRLVSL